MKVAVVGAGGFVGRALTAQLQARGETVLPVVRKPAGLAGERRVDDLASAEWSAILADAEVVVLVAARVHIMKDPAPDPVAEFRRVNRDGALSVFQGAVEAGVRRLIFVSTVKVNGEGTLPGQPFTADATPDPSDPYAISKHEAEQALKALAAESGVELTIVRPTLVYGPGVGANFATMMRWIGRGLPLPLGGITQNRRSLVGIDNLTDFLMACMAAPAAAGETFLVSDGRDFSTAELLRHVARAMDRPARLLPVPPRLLTAAGRILGKEEALERLTGSLQIDISKNRDLLGWTPPVSTDDGLRRAAQAFLRGSRQ